MSDAADSSTEQKFDAADFEWKVVGRYDTYINATNTKGALLMTLTTFVFASIVLKYTDLTGAAAFRQDQSWAANLTGLALVAAAFFALHASWIVFQVVKPNLSSEKRVGEYHSAIFFQHVAEHNTPDAYANAVNALDKDAATRDLAFQAHALAGILASKFRRLSEASDVVLYRLLPSLALLLVIRVITMGVDVLMKLK